MPLDLAADPGPLIVEGPCPGDSYVIVNPDWPAGTGPYRAKCAGCPNCRRSTR